MTTTYETLLYEAADGVATVTLNRPNVHNAMNEALRRDMMRCFETLATDETVRVIVVTGAGGKAFSAGADIREFTAPQVPTVFRENRRRLDFRAAMEKLLAADHRGHRRSLLRRRPRAGPGLRHPHRRRPIRAWASPRSTSPSSPAAAAPSGCRAWSDAARRWR